MYKWAEVQMCKCGDVQVRGCADKGIKNHGKQSLLLFLFLLFICNVSAQTNTGHSHLVTIIFHNKIAAADLNIDSSYTNAFGEIYTVKKLKYYVSNIEFRGEDKKDTQSFAGQYFLIDEADEVSKTIELTSTLKNITSIHFLIGVDSIQNVSGVQTGALDPAKGMFWVWNTGYIMAKFEGISTAANAPGHSFTYDVGGYKPAENTAREISLNLSYAANKPSNTIHINADINKWFNALHPVSIASTPLCHQPGKLAVQIADNYSTMFSIASARE